MHSSDRRHGEAGDPHGTVRAEAAGWSYRLRLPTEADGAAVWRIVDASTLDTNSPYAYLMWFRYFAATSVVAEAAAEGAAPRPVGFLAGFTPPGRPDTRFVWQVSVHPALRGRGLARAMLRELAARGEAPARTIEATVTPSNAASLALFRGFAAERDVPCEETLCFPESLFPGGAHEPEILLRIGPLEPAAKAAHPRNGAEP